LDTTTYLDFCFKLFKNYTYNFEYASVSFGHTYYDFPGSTLFSREFYVGISFPDIIFSPSITYYHDYGDEDKGGGDGDYVLLGFSHSFILVDDSKVTFNAGLNVAYNNKLFIDGDGGDVGVTLGFTFSLIENVAIVPSVNYVIPFGGVSNAEDGGQKNRLYGPR